MIKNILDADTSLFLFLHPLGHPYLNDVMTFISNSYIPTVILASIIVLYGIKKQSTRFFKFFCVGIIAIGLSDAISSHIFKPTFKRLRPCKEEVLTSRIKLVEHKCWGGKYGFVSSHSSNTFTIATFFFLIFRAYTRKFAVLFLYAALVAYSRIYLAKHYPLDIFCGAILGIAIGYIMAFFSWNFFDKIDTQVPSS